MKAIRCLSIYLFFVFISPSIDGARILAISHTSSKSHWILYHPLLLELASSGHEVTVVSPFPLKNPPKNYRDIVLTGMEDQFGHMMDKVFDEAADNTPRKCLDLLIDFSTILANGTLWHPNVRKLIESNEKFDLVFMESFVSDAFLGFGHRFDCPVVAMSTIGLTNFVNDMIGAPMPWSIIPHDLLSYRKDMTFWQRFYNVLFHSYDRIKSWAIYWPGQEAIYQEAFPGPKPSLYELRQTKVALMLLNSHFTLNFPKPLPPNMIEVAGLQINWDPKPLPKDLADFVESAENGVIYFSLGSNAKPSLIPKEKLNGIIAALSRTKQKIMWKFDAELNLDPTKFLVQKWFPQDSILAHPKVKLFITHGGLLSCTESVFHGKPIVGIPIFGDQQGNMDKVREAGWGIRLDYVNVTESSLNWALREIFENPIYAQNAAKISRRFRDQPMTPLQKAKFWVEYVLRNKDSLGYMKLRTLELSWIEYYNLDVFALVGAAIVLIVYVMGRVIRGFFAQKNVTKMKKN